MMQKRVIIISLIALLIVGFSLPVYATNYATDITGHWAYEEITNLLSKDILQTYDGNKFKPNQPITREEFAVGLAKGLELEMVFTTNLTDIQSHPAKGYIASLVHKQIITGYPDQTFRPDKEISRAELVTMLIRALELNRTETEIKLKDKQYSDIPATDYWANNSINLASKLKIINGYPDGTFRPQAPVTRAEAAKMLHHTLQLRIIDGTLQAKYPTANKIKIKKSDGTEMVLVVGDEALIGRNNRLVDLTELKTNDNLHLLANQNNKVEYLKAYGVITKADVAAEVSDLSNGLFDPQEVMKLSQGDTEVVKKKAKEKVSQLTNDFLSPHDLELIAHGDYERLEPKLRIGIETQLIKQGLTYQEAAALLDTDWNALEDLGQERLVEAVAMKAGLPVDVTKALLDQNWTRLRKLAEVELIQRAASKMLTSDLLS
ncbi:MAG: S-layer homology domain-containing protein [Bacillota bacterium]